MKIGGKKVAMFKWWLKNDTRTAEGLPGNPPAIEIIRPLLRTKTKYESAYENTSVKCL